jgi:hypothetical protein
MNRDRAGVAATTILAIITEALRSWIRGGPSTPKAVRSEIEEFLRGEFTDCAREARAEQRDPVDN